MLIILTTHPIQYQVPLWQALARNGRVPFEVWYLSHHGLAPGHDREFGKTFAWDIDLLSGYRSRLLEAAPGASPSSFLDCRSMEPLERLLRQSNARAVWIQGWRVLADWQAAFAAKPADCELWLRAESNDLAPVPFWKRPIKRLVLSQLFSRVDRFLCIGSANRRLYASYGVDPTRMLVAPYAVDNDRFAEQAAALRERRGEIRRAWGIAENDFCVLFCGKFVTKKNPLLLVDAARRILPQVPNLHLLFVGSGELGEALRGGCQVVYDAESSSGDQEVAQRAGRPRASFAGFMNQTEISRAYVAADVLVLPSDFGETWGLVVNEAMASGLPCVVSDHCGSAEDLGKITPNRVCRFGDPDDLAGALSAAATSRQKLADDALRDYSFNRTVDAVAAAYCELGSS